MQNLWNDTEAKAFSGDLGERVYSSRLLGRDPSLVLHGGGNTSVKTTVTNIFGEAEDILFVKGSGWDLETIEQAGFAPCRMADLLRLAELPTLSDPQMALELRKSLIDPAAPAPSVEAILHAILPAKFVDHTHADAVLAITNTADGEARAREIWGDRLVIIPYVMPGFLLARLCADIFPREAGPRTEGMLLLNHGIFSFGETARESYERMIALVGEAESYLAAKGAPLKAAVRPDGGRGLGCRGAGWRREVAELRSRISEAAGVPMLLAVQDDPASLDFARRPDLAAIAGQGPATPDHVIRTKRVPMIGRDVDDYVRRYSDYFVEHGYDGLAMLDPAPRVVLDPEFGLLTVGRTARDAAIVADIYAHTIDIIGAATDLAGWQALGARDIFEVEYWDLEQAKLKKAGSPPAFAGEVALVTGAASGIGRACVASLLKRGAAVIGVDLDPAVGRDEGGAYRGVIGDLTDPGTLQSALDCAVRAFGGLDMLVLNAGIFPPSTPIAEQAEESWRRTMAINLDVNVSLLAGAHPLLKLSPRGGRVVVIGSKNVPAPGPGAGAYSASKAALQQLARVAALEWGRDRIRINTLHPNAVFDTGIWTPEVLERRAASYGLSVEAYKANNLLRVEVTSGDVAELAAELLGPLFARTTGAQIPVDGGNDRVV